MGGVVERAGAIGVAERAGVVGAIGIAGAAERVGAAGKPGVVERAGAIGAIAGVVERAGATEVVERAGATEVVGEIGVAQSRRLVRTLRELERGGLSQRAVREAVGAGELIRLQRNRYVEGEVWRELRPESRHLLELVSAAAEMTTGSTVFSHASAAVLHGLPLYRHAPLTVHVTVRPGGGMPSRAGLFRHRDALPVDDVVDVDGIRCTSLARTVIDTCRTAPPEVGIAVADAALRRVAMSGSEYDQDAALRWCEEAHARLAQMDGARGVRRARAILEMTDGRAESPGESVSRWRWVEAGFEGIVVQPVVVLGDGRRRRCDLAITALRTLFEFDGKVKYLNADMRAGRTAEEVVVAEKIREDEIRAVTGWRVLRAVDSDIATPTSFAAYLARTRIR